MNTELSASGALRGLTVLDLTRARAGPTAARQLADWGASVIKIESPGDARAVDLGNRHGPDFQNLHRGKRAMVLDLKSSEGLAIFMRLATGADVVIENYRPGVKFRLGIDYESLRKVNSRIVLGSISGFGQDGPYRDRPGLDQIAQGMGGHMSVTGEPGRGPMRSGAAIADMSAGFLLANGILMALLERERSGEGQWVATSLLEAQIFLLDFQAARWLVDEDVAGQAGNTHPTIVPTGAFRTADGHVNIAPNPAMWEKLCTCLEAPELMTDPDFMSLADRTHNRDRLFEEIEARTVKRRTADWVERMNAAGVPCGPIYRLDETFNDAQVRHLGIAQTVDSPALGPTQLVGQAIHMSRTPSRLAAPAPEPGQHTHEILAGLGLDEAEIADLKARDIV